jgi:hypothetical protein
MAHARKRVRSGAAPPCAREALRETPFRTDVLGEVEIDDNRVKRTLTNILGRDG